MRWSRKRPAPGVSSPDVEPSPAPRPPVPGPRRIIDLLSRGGDGTEIVRFQCGCLDHIAPPGRYLYRHKCAAHGDFAAWAEELRQP